MGPMLLSTVSNSNITETIRSAFETAVSGIKLDVTDMLVIALPAGLAIFGLSFAIRKGVRFFQSLAN